MAEYKQLSVILLMQINDTEIASSIMRQHWLGPVNYPILQWCKCTDELKNWTEITHGKIRRIRRDFRR